MNTKQEQTWDEFRTYEKNNKKVLDREDKSISITITLNTSQKHLLMRLLTNDIDRTIKEFSEEIHSEEPDSYLMGLIDLEQERAAKLYKIISQAKYNV